MTFLLLAIAALAYFNALAAGFQFDDFNVIVDNPAVHSLAAWWDGMPGIRPLLKLSYTLNWLADPGPMGFHAVNVLLHLVNVALVWRLTGHLPAATPDSRLRTRVLATLLFAVHPIQTESVTYVSGRSMVLMASFGLAGLLAWLEAPARARPSLWRLAAFLLLTAAILTKEVAVALPLTLLLFRQEGRLARYVPLILAGLALAALFGLFGYRHLFAEPAPRDLAANLLSEANAVYYLLGQLLRPWALNIDPVLPELSGWSLLSAAQAAGLAAAVAVAWRFRHSRPWLTFAVAWFVILLLPTHSLIPRLDLASERHLYLAGLGPFWLAGVALAALPGRLAWAAVVVLALAGVAFTHLRNLDYRDEIGLWRQTTTQSPDNARAWNNLGWAFYLAGRKDEARQAFQRTLTIEPGHDQALRNLQYLDEAKP
jgi:tetratricopeptide (TPR) repeat protein